MTFATIRETCDPSHCFITAMTTPTCSRSLHSKLLLAACTLATSAYFASPVRADDAPAQPPPKGSISIGVKQTAVKVQAPAASTNGTNGTSKSSSHGFGPPAPPSDTQAAENDLTYTITVKNNAKVPAKGLTLEYHFYNRKMQTDNGVTTYSLDDITATQNVDIDPGKSVDVVTQSIPQQASSTVTQAQSSSYGFGSKGSNKPAQSFTNTKLLGYTIVVKFNDKAITPVKSDPADLQDQLDKLKKQMQVKSQ